MFRTLGIRVAALATAILGYGGLAVPATHSFAISTSYAVVHTHAGFGNIWSMAADSHGNVLLVDEQNSRIDKFSAKGRLLERYAMPRDVCIGGAAAAASGEVYGTSYCGGKISRFSSGGRLLGRFGGSQGKGKSRTSPAGVAADSHGHIFVTYTTTASGKVHPNSRIEEYSASGKRLKVLARGKINDPFRLVVDSHGDIYVGAVEGLVKVSAAGHILKRSHAAATFGPAPQFQPFQPALDRRGHVYVANDTGNIIELTPSLRVLRTVLQGGPGSTSVQDPAGMTISSDGRLYVADSAANNIKVFSLKGKLLAIWLP
jgi:streptogramin lyase